MKKLALVLVALLTIVFTGCKSEKSNVTIYVDDEMGVPVPNRYIFYTDESSYIIDELLPSPDAMITNVNDSWEDAQTNAYGKVTIEISMSVAKMKYYFEVYDAGSNQWKEQKPELKRGKNEDLKFVVNR